ncbi:MAG TPA: AtaL-like protein [Methylibium sp.]|uniref:AtaL-like protein n=1 Tax=Methylibium sp. TaxID=2067992 RepID=UPI002DBA21EA|nr:AtaL-like protein [Methylibium sp.]HEU4460582.1 AtaL-like protein [Methylibium sp.]
MRYEHLLQVTDPLDPAVPPMSRDELWRGLMRRVESPQSFELGPDHCEVEPGADASRRRRSIHFGALRFDDEVHIEPMQRLVFATDPREGTATVGLTISIEEPEPGALFLRFVYAVDEPASGTTVEDQALQRYREQAWLEMDRDMLRTLRQWQREGRL